MDKRIERSTFVSVVAWIFIVLSGFGTMMSILQNVMIQVVMADPAVRDAMQTPPMDAPAFAIFLFSNFQLFFLLFLLVSALTLASSIGLLLRRNWARVAFIGLMALGVVWNLGGLALQLWMFSSMREQFAALPEGPDMQPFFIVISAVSVLFALVFSGLFGWIARRLLSAPVAAEFAR